jgi:hypothetical protein
MRAARDLRLPGVGAGGTRSRARGIVPKPVRTEVDSTAPAAPRGRYRDFFAPGFDFGAAFFDAALGS